MNVMRDPIVLWAIGAFMLIVAALGAVAAGSIVWLPLALAFAALGYSQESVLLVLAYTAVVWLPLGFGAGIATAFRFLKGYIAPDPGRN
jgi:hypothetical protein